MTTLVCPSVKITATVNKPEIQLLLCCARTHIDLQTTERIRTLLQEDIDWEDLIQTAICHGVMPVLYQSLKNTCPEAVPQVILNHLQNYFHANAARNLFLTSELINLLKLFQKRDISVIPFKGPVLAASAYGNLALRQIGDLDILVHKRDFERAKALLISQGYQSGRDLDWQHSFVSNDGRYSVDLHQGITPPELPFRIDFEHLWQNAESASLAGTRVINLSPEDLLLILCVQLVRDCRLKREHLAKVCDLAKLLRVSPFLDWGRIMEHANTLGSERMLLTGLSLASELLEITLPPEVLLRIQAEDAVRWLAAQVRQWLFRDAGGLPDSLSQFKRAPFLLKSRERLKDKVPYLCYLLYFALTPNKGYAELLPLPRPLHFLYYLIRPIQLVGRYGAILLKRFPGLAGF